MINTKNHLQLANSSADTAEAKSEKSPGLSCFAELLNESCNHKKDERSANVQWHKIMILGSPGI